MARAALPIVGLVALPPLGVMWLLQTPARQAGCAVPAVILECRN